ncbi:hypothetical protein [Streptomyces sp. NPDC059894]|uniref:hypothetical protein n=1 Tax=unclassified Streptomyces TaxID=2593676 RepID=UPI003654474F
MADGTSSPRVRSAAGGAADGVAAGGGVPGPGVVSTAPPRTRRSRPSASRVRRPVNHGRDRFPPAPAAAEGTPHYDRLAYSTATAPAPETPPDGSAPGPDNHIALVGGSGPSRRNRIHPLYAEGRRAASWHTPATGARDTQDAQDTQDAREAQETQEARHAQEAQEAQDAPERITTVGVVHGPWEVRLHLVRAPAGSLVREGGWAVADDDAPPAAQAGPDWAVVHREDGLTSLLAGLSGWTDTLAGSRGEVVRAEGHNAYGRHSAVPVLTGRHPGGSLLLASLVVLTADPALGADLRAVRAGAEVRVREDGTVVVRFPDGTTECVPGPGLTPSSATPGAARSRSS